jgi:hypothetical protein
LDRLIQDRDVSLLSDSFVSKAKAILAAHPSLQHMWHSNSGDAPTLTFPSSAPEGFDVVVSADTTELTVQAGGAQMKFCALTSEQVPGVVAEALGFVRDLLSPSMRVRTLFAGSRARKWILEHSVAGEWSTETVTGLLFWNYLAPRRETIRQNHQLAARDERE